MKESKVAESNRAGRFSGLISFNFSRWLGSWYSSRVIFKPDSDVNASVACNVPTDNSTEIAATKKSILLIPTSSSLYRILSSHKILEGFIEYHFIILLRMEIVK
jgi:hypothetical protein